MLKNLKIDFISDVSCPWCAIGLNTLELAIEKISTQAKVSINFQPFELNPNMIAQGEFIDEHLERKYGMSSEQLEASFEHIVQRGAEVGFIFSRDKRKKSLTPLMLIDFYIGQA